MKKTNLIIPGLIGLAALAGCKHNPYSGTTQPGQRIVTDNPANHQEQTNPPSIEAPDTIECTEGAACGAEIIGRVAEPATAILTITGLPKGAVYDASKNFLSYTPGFDVVDVAAHPDRSEENFNLMVKVQNSMEPQSTSSFPIKLTVKNKMQAVNISVLGDTDTDEGTTLEQTVEVQSTDFPEGPFYLTAINAPVGAEVKAVEGSNTQFKVKFTPGFTFVTVYDKAHANSYYTKDVKLTYQVGLPIGQAVKKDVTWRINDVRQLPAISSPENTTQGLDVSFSIRAEDINGENAPKINVSAEVPFGRINSTTIAETSGQGLSFPSKIVLVRWDQLKINHLGTTTPINYEVCVQKYSGSYTHCTQKKVLVTLKSDIHQAPKVDRSNWGIGELKSLRIGTPVTFKLPIHDAEDLNLPVDVKVTSSQTGAVTWKNGILTVNPQTEGVLQFGVTAESVFGREITENFVVEVFPNNWAKTVLITGDAVQGESVESAKLISSVDLLSAKFQVSARTLALRESCMLTTEAVGSAKIDEKLQDLLYHKMSSVLVSTPMVDDLKGKMEADLKAFGIKIKGRLNRVVPHADISSMTLVVDAKSNLESPKVPAGLKGKLTAESSNPLIFDLDQLSSKCVPLFLLQKPAVSESIGVTCKNGSKTFTVLGFELADVLLDKKDQPLLGKWMNTFLNGKAK